MIEEQFIFLNENFDTKEAVFQFLAQQAVSGEKARCIEDVYKAFVSRESESTTGMLDGFAIPHAKSSAITQACCMVIKNNRPIEWAALDGKGVHIIIALLIPEQEQNSTHLQALSKIARLLMKKDVKQQLKSATSKQEILTNLTL